MTVSPTSRAYSTPPPRIAALITGPLALLLLVACEAGTPGPVGGESVTADGVTISDGTGGPEVSQPQPGEPEPAEPDVSESVGCVEGAPCDDGDPCTSDDACDAAGGCAGAPIECADEDGSPCTTETCVAGECRALFTEGLCDDGIDCTPESTCLVGRCIGEKVDCPQCEAPTGDHALKVVDISIAAGGHPGIGLDVDEEPKTCAPAGDCTGGIDNSLSALGNVVNEGVADSLAAGAILYVADLNEAPLDGSTFDFAVHDTDLTVESFTAGCDWQADTCDYWARPYGFDAGCTPWFHLPGATFDGTTLRAGGQGTVIVVSFALTPGTLVPLTLVHARLEAEAEMSADGTRIVRLSGVIGGATPKALLTDTLAAIDAEDLPGDKDFLLDLLDEVVEADIDLDGDGVLEGASVALRFDTIPAVLVEAD